MDFIDYRKAVDYGEKTFALQELKNQGLQDKYSRIIAVVTATKKWKWTLKGRNLEWKMEANKAIHFHHKSSPVYWNTYSENWSNKTILNFKGRKLNKSSFEDEIAIFDSSNGEMQEMVKVPPKLSADAGVRIDTKNTEVITNTAAREIKLKVLDLEYVLENNWYHSVTTQEKKSKRGVEWLGRSSGT